MENKTNGDLKYPIGLLTADEVAFAGAYKYDETNKSYYLYDSSMTSKWWLLSPYDCDSYYANGFYVTFLYGSMYVGSVNSREIIPPTAFRPSINLKAELLVIGGDGTKENPYMVG